MLIDKKRKRPSAKRYYMGTVHGERFPMVSVFDDGYEKFLHYVAIENELFRDLVKKGFFEYVNRYYSLTESEVANLQEQGHRVIKCD